MSDHTFMRIAQAIAAESKCISLQVGAVIVRDNRVISTGCNGTPNGFLNCCDHAEAEGWRKDNKFQWAQAHHEWSKSHEVHAELNAILGAARHGVAIDGCTLYCTHSPCNDCAKAIAQSGIIRVVYKDEYLKASSEWRETILHSCVLIRLLGDV